MLYFIQHDKDLISDRCMGHLTKLWDASFDSA